MSAGDERETPWCTSVQAFRNSQSGMTSFPDEPRRTGTSDPFAERRDRLEALGVDVSNYRPPLPLHPSEFRTSHPDLTPEERLREEEQQLLDLRARIEERLAVLAA